MRIQEEQHEGEWTWLWWLGNWTAIDSDCVKSIGFAWLFKEGGKWRLLPRITGNVALFYNAMFFIRLSFPAGLFWTIRWAAKGSRAYWQSGLGWKLNGRLSVTFRIQGDAASASGVTGPNIGQAQGFDYGPH
jgi:hypothetical protein